MRSRTALITVGEHRRIFSHQAGLNNGVNDPAYIHLADEFSVDPMPLELRPPNVALQEAFPSDEMSEWRGPGEGPYPWNK